MKRWVRNVVLVSALTAPVATGCVAARPARPPRLPACPPPVPASPCPSCASPPPAPPAPPPPAAPASIAWLSIVGDDVVCAGFDDGRARCRRFPGDAAVIASFTGVRAITSDFLLRTDGTVARWTLPDEPGGAAPVTERPALSGSAAVTGTDESGCALARDGTVRCWGQTLTGGKTGGEPIRVSLPEPAARLDGDAYHACALTARGEVYCWGDNHHAECGVSTYQRINDTELIVPAPVRVPGVVGAVDVRAFFTTCARLADGGVMCWGDAMGSVINDKAASDHLLSLPRTSGDERAVAQAPPGAFYRTVYKPPSRLPGVAGVAQLGVGKWRWMRFADGTLGYDRSSKTRPKVETFPGVQGAIDLTVGLFVACARTAAGRAFCWSYGRPWYTVDPDPSLPALRDLGEIEFPDTR